MSSLHATLNTLGLGQRATVCGLSATDKARRRMIDLGLIPGTVVEALHQSPSGDPIAYRIRGAVIALRSAESSHIYVQRAGAEGVRWV